MNGINGSYIFKAMSKFCGLPIGLVTLPIVIANARASNNNFGEVLYCEASISITRVPIIASVSSSAVQMFHLQQRGLIILACLLILLCEKF